MHGHLIYIGTVKGCMKRKGKKVIEMGSVLAAAEGASGLTITSEMFDGLTTAVTSNANVLIPVGVGIMGIMVAIGLIPKIIRKFMG